MSKNDSTVMVGQDDELPAAGATTLYRIRVKGCLAPGWASWFEGMIITPGAGGDTLLTGEVADQAALHGLLKKVRDLGLPLLAVHCLERNEENNG